MFRSWKLNCGRGADDEDVVVLVSVGAAVVVAGALLTAGNGSVLTGGVGGMDTTGWKVGGESGLVFLEPDRR